MKEDYRFHEGCEYQLAVATIQKQWGVLPDQICPVCSSRGAHRVSAKNSIAERRPKERKRSA